jgi:ABC-type ATPase involved in cell division
VALLGILRDRVEAGVGVLAATHDERFVADFAARTVSIDAGRIVADTAATAPATSGPDRSAAAVTVS